MIVDKKMKGTQLISNNDFKDDFVEMYKINGIPRFILLDPEGNIVSANTLKPSDPKLIDLFNELEI